MQKGLFEEKNAKRGSPGLRVLDSSAFIPSSCDITPILPYKRSSLFNSYNIMNAQLPLFAKIVIFNEKKGEEEQRMCGMSVETTACPSSRDPPAPATNGGRCLIVHLL